MNKAGHGRFADPEATAKAVQAAARGSYRLPATVNDSVNQVMSVSIAAMRALESQIKTMEKVIEQQFEIIPNTLTSVSGIGKVYSAGIIAEIGDDTLLYCIYGVVPPREIIQKEVGDSQDAASRGGIFFTIKNVKTS